MRPRKRILIWGATEQSAAILRIVLDAWGYAVEVAGTKARLLSRKHAPDAFLLLGFDADEQTCLGKKLHALRSGAGVVFVPARGVMDEGLWIATVRYRIKIATYRRGGPRNPDSQNMQNARAVAACYAKRLAKQRRAA